MGGGEEGGVDIRRSVFGEGRETNGACYLPSQITPAETDEPTLRRSHLIGGCYYKVQMHRTVTIPRGPLWLQGNEAGSMSTRN